MTSLSRQCQRVLILVLVEHTLRGWRDIHKSFQQQVLILVLVEHTLRGSNTSASNRQFCLNPCFSGTYSQSYVLVLKEYIIGGLNPCFSGTYSQSAANPVVEPTATGLNPCFSGTYSQSQSFFIQWSGDCVS